MAKVCSQMNYQTTLSAVANAKTHTHTRWRRDRNREVHRMEWKEFRQLMLSDQLAKGIIWCETLANCNNIDDLSHSDLIIFGEVFG